MTQHLTPRSILITGASSGIGAALAQCYADSGIWLYLTGRDPSRLEAVAAACEAKGAAVSTRRLDVTDAAAMAGWIEGICDAEGAPDLVIANAGISAGTAGGGESPAQTCAIFRVNLDGVLHTVLPVIPAMRRQRRGQIAIMSSLAGFNGMPGAPAYSASKAAVKSWGEGLRGWLARDGVQVSVICPGFVRTPLTEVNRFHMPFLMEAEEAAQRIRCGLARNQGLIAFPWQTALAVRLLAMLPFPLRERIYAAMPEKSG